MNDDIYWKLWVIKFCLKLVFPKFNCYSFLVFLAIKYRISRKRILTTDIMENYELKTVSLQNLRALLKNRLEYNLDILHNKIIVIPKEQYIQLCSQNLFYIDHGVVWLAIKLSSECKTKYENKQTTKDHIFRSNFHFVASEIHKKLWSDNITNSRDSIRIVPVTGSKLVYDNFAQTTENEYHNILSTFELDYCENITVTFHTVPSLENAPKIAATAEVNLIVNDFDLANDFIKEVLSNYFEQPKLLTENDIFSIDLTPKITAKYHHKYLDLVESTGKIYFRCKNLGDNVNKDTKILKAYFIVKGMTQLTLGENIHVLKPRDEFINLQDHSGCVHNLKACPIGLRHKFQQIQDTIKPFLTGDIEILSTALSNPIIPMLLLTGSTGSGRHLVVKTLAKYNGMNCLQIDCNGLQSSTAKQTESKVNSTIQKAKAAAPVIVVLDNFEVFAVDPENNEDCRVMEHFMNSITDLYQNYTKHPIIFIAITERLDLKPNILRIFLDKFHIPRLNVQQRCEMLQWFASVMELNIDGEKNETQDLDSEDILSKQCNNVLQRIAAKTETFLYGDLDTLMHFAMRESYLKQHNAYNQLPPIPDFHIVEEEDFNSALDSIRSLQSQHLDAPKIPKVYWEDIGGLEKLKKELLKTIEFPIKYPHLFKNSSLKRSGILMYGPPGCGKTLIAKAVSTELNVSFLSVKGPELLNMYIGQSEENVRKVFESARASSPCIVFLDELDALAPARGSAGDSGGASDRVVSQLLAQLDGVCGTDEDSSSFVFVMGATNRPDLLEQSLLRPGRLDKMIYVGPYVGLQEKTSVLKALCRNHNLRPEVKLEDVALALPEQCTGADLLQVVSNARSAAVRALVDKLNAGQIKESELSADSVILGISELCAGVDSFKPSVTDEELAYYESLVTNVT